MPKWYVDQSRYIEGFACPWRRLLKYHAMGLGLELEATWNIDGGLPDTIAGTYLHDAIEKLYHTTIPAPTSDDVEGVLADIPTLGKGNPYVELRGLVHAYTRVVMPYILERYEFITCEEEFSLDLGDDIVYMARPDVIVRSRESGLVSEISLKSTQSKPSTVAAIHAQSLQSIMNAYAVSTKYGQCESVQIHMLGRGTDKYPSPITHAYYRPGDPPLLPDSWQPSKFVGGRWLRGYTRVEVAKHRPVASWVWEMDSKALEERVPILINALDPTIQGRKVVQAIASVKENETNWRRLIQEVEALGWDKVSRKSLDKWFPRTFQCIQYARACEWHDVCFSEEADSNVLNIPVEYTNRIPHHPQEGEE